MTTASVMTYDSLVENVQSYLERTDTATIEKIPLFIMLAEQTIATEIKFIGNLQVVTANMTANNPVIQKPARWRKTVSFNITDADNDRQPVLLRRYEYIREYWPDQSQTGLPKFYTDYDAYHWLVAPTPSTTSAFEVLYYERLQPLDSDNQSNWFTNYAPQALLYGTLLQAMPFLKNDARMAMWKAQYEAAIAALKTEDATRVGDRQAVAIDT
jgi:hypothetical protein